MSVHVVLNQLTARKQADNEGDRHALAHEARVLAAVAHPGVVRLIDTVGDPPDALVLERAAGSLTDLGTQTPEEVAAWGAAVFTTLGDLHDLGWVHGGLAAEHLLFDEGGRPLLCSFSRAQRVADSRAAARLRRADVAAMARIVGSRMPAAERRVGALLAAAAGRPPGARRLRRIGTPGARQLAEALAARAKAQPAVGRPRRTARRVALVLCGLSAAAAGTWWVVGDRHGTEPALGPVHTVFLAAAGERYSLSAPAGQHDLAKTGRWDCRDVEVAVLDTRSGWLWLFPKLPPPGGAATGRPVARFRGARALRTLPLGRCDRLEIVRTGRVASRAAGTGG